MATGTVKFFNTSKGYGFIQPEEGGTDVFVHMTALDKAGIGTLKEGQRVQFDVVKGQNGKEAADNLSLGWFMGVLLVGESDLDFPFLFLEAALYLEC